MMLGRLGMTVDECIRAYRKVAQQAFTPKWKSLLTLPSSGSFSAKAFESAIKNIVKEFCIEAQCVARRREGHSTVETCPHSETGFQNMECTKTYVLRLIL